MTRIETALLLIVAICLLFCGLTWQDNRVMARKLAERECVSKDSHKTLLEACEVITHVNRRQEQIIIRTQEALGVQEGGGNGQVFRATRDTGSRKDRGLGGP